MSVRRLISVALASLCGLAMGLLCGGAPALAARGHVLEGSFGKAGSGNGELSAPANVAVNEATGEVYVLDKGNDRVEYFTAAGAYLGQFNGSGLLSGEGKAAGSGSLPEEVPTGKFDEPEGIAVDNACYEHQPRLEGSACEAFDPSNGDVYVADTHGHAELQSEAEVSKQVVDKYSATGGYVGQVTRNPTGVYDSLGFRELYGVAVDSTGELWIEEQNFGSTPVGAANYSNAATNTFVGFRETIGAGFVREGGFAVDSQDDLYVTLEGAAGANFVSEFDPDGGLLATALDEEATTGIATEAPSEDIYLDNVGSVARFGPEGSRVEGLPIERLSAPGMHGTGVAVNSATGQVYVADSAGVVHVFKLEEPSQPTVENESVSNISGNSATFGAEINPRGASTEYRFEYGPNESYGNSVPIPDGSIGGGFEVQSVGLHLQSLEPGVKYHFRVVANNAHGTTDGEGKTFNTQTAGELTLLDGRIWEMVSPPAKLGADIKPIGEVGLVQASLDGDAITYGTSSPTEPESQGYTNGHMQVLSRRAPGGWASQDIGLPHPQATGSSVGEGYEYRFFSEDLSLGLVQPFGTFDSTVSVEASEQTPFLRSDYLNGNASEACLPSQMACYHPLVTGAPGYANVPSGTVFGEAQYGAGEKPCNIEAPLICGPIFVDASPDSKHVVISSPVALTPGSGGGLYEWNAGQLTPVPDIGEIGARHGISDDGSRIISTDSEVTMRDVPKGETIQLATAQGGTESGGGEFQTASADASRVFFTDGNRLTADASGSRDLYECEMVEVAGKLTCKLTDLTPAGPGGEAAGVLGDVLGASEDGSYVYFVAEGVLAAGAVQGTCGARGREMCNLYVRHDGVTKLVAVLSGADANDWATTLNRLTARVSPDGQWLAFMSEQDLTGYSTRDALSGKLDEEVYLYDADSGTVVCASCDPTGARPLGVPYEDINDGLVGGDRVWESGQGIAANVPGWTPYQLDADLYQSRYLSDSGRLFFNSSDALVPQDVNGAEDVYEYEPPGIGSCASTSTTYSERAHGCIDLISSGTSGEESAFLDASASGGDVFFLTAAKLSPQDYDTALDVYDAHECTSAVPCQPTPASAPPPCTTGDACKPSPTPQPTTFGAPASATFSGAGNIAAGSSPTSTPAVKAKSLTRAQKLARALKACHRKRRKPRAKCERQARARYAQSSHKVNTTKRSRG
jgi:DNA-binding beta-propeller fold protein YncE